MLSRQLVLCRKAAVKSLPILIYRTDNIFLSVLSGYQIYFENSEISIALEIYSLLLLSILNQCLGCAGL